MTVCEDTVFYSNKSDDNKLYKINGDGTGKAKLSNNKATFINASHDYVYYVNYLDNENLYKIPVIGGKSEKITNEYGTNITILKDKIFFNGIFYGK
jgi:transglutaminase/protease-like cytokinesis protein 3